MLSPTGLLVAEAGVDIFPHLGNSALILGTMAGLFTSIAVRRTPHLEGKLAALRRLLLLLGLAAALLVTAVLGQSRGPAPLPLDADTAAIRAYLEALRDHDRGMSFYVAGLPLLLMALVSLPVVLHVLDAASSFVLHQRTDLLARDQAKGWTDAPR